MRCEPTIFRSTATSTIKTPAIDALAADGVIFDRAYSHAPLTLPAHASLLSGRLPFETGVRDEAGFAVKDSERMLAEILEDRGYATGARGLVVRPPQGHRHRSGLRVLRRGAAALSPSEPSASRCSATAWSRNGSRSDGSSRSERRGRSCSSISPSRTSRTRRRNASPSTSRTTARSPTPTRSSAAWCGT